MWEVHWEARRPRICFRVGHGVVQYETGERLDLLPGNVFHITTVPHDSWVEGNAEYVSLHVLGP